MNTLFQNAQILRRDGSVLRGCLGVTDNRIAFVGEIPEGFAAQRVIDCEDNLLIPGLVNAHTHLPMTLFRNIADDLPLQEWLFERIFPMEDKLTADDVYWATQLALAESLRGGTTCVCDMYQFEDTIMEAAAISGIRGLFCRPTLTEEGPVNSRLAEAVRFHQQWNGAENGSIAVGLGPHAEYTNDERTMRMVADEAARLNCKLHIHVSETFQEHSECKRRHLGKTPTMVLDSVGLLNQNSLLAHCVEVEPGDIALLAEKGATVLHCPQSNLKLGSGIAPVPLLLAAGVNVALGTDGAASNNNLDMFEELRLAATLHKGVTQCATAVTAREAMTMATANGANALGFAAGALEVGLLADIVLTDTKAPHMLPRSNPLHGAVYGAGAADVLFTMVDGRVVYERGEYYTLDIDRIRSEVERIMERYGREE